MSNASSYKFSSVSISEPNTRHYLILFLLWPFLAFLTAIFNYRNKDSRNVVYLFLIYYGLTFYLGNTGMDSARYAFYLEQTVGLPFNKLFEVIGGLYTDTTVDIAEPIIRFVISRFTGSHGVLFAVWVAIMGYFYLKSINLLYDRYKDNRGLNPLIFMTFFIFIVPITTVSGIRMPTAVWIFFFGAYHVILYRDRRYLLLALSSSLIHWSFLIANAILLIYFFAGNRNIIYFPLVVLSFLLPQILSPYFQSIAMLVGGPIQSRYEGYSNQEYIINVRESYENASWFMGLSDNLLFYFLLIAIIIIQLFSGRLMKDKHEKNLFSFVLLFLAFLNFGKMIPTLGTRFQEVFYLFATLYIFLYLVKKQINKINLITLLGLFPMLLFTAIRFRVGTETINAWIITPIIGLPLFTQGFSIAELFFH